MLSMPFLNNNLYYEKKTSEGDQWVENLVADVDIDAFLDSCFDDNQSPSVSASPLNGSGMLASTPSSTGS